MSVCFKMATTKTGEKQSMRKLKWYKNLYVGNNAKEKKRKIVWNIRLGIGMIDIYVITLASNGTDYLDIFSANYLLQKSLHYRTPVIVGIAQGYSEALEVVCEITEDALRERKEPDLRGYLEDKIRQTTTG